MEDYLDCFEEESDRRRARDLLTALAYAEGAGLPHDHEDEHDLWPRVAGALAKKTYGVYGGDDVDWVLHSAAADLVDETTADGTSAYRLFHQALSDHLRGLADVQRQGQQAFARALEALVPEDAQRSGRDWPCASPYIRTQLATHAAAGGILDHMLEDVGFLLAVDATRLLRALPAAGDSGVRDAKLAFQHVAHLLPSASPGERAAYLELAARQNGAVALADRIADLQPDRPWSTLWARWRSASDHFTAGRHDDWVNAVAVGELGGRPVIVSGDNEGTVRVWELADGTPIGDPLKGHDGWVSAVAVGELGGRPVIVSGGNDQTVRVWELADGTPIGDPLKGHDGWVSAVAVGETRRTPGDRLRRQRSDGAGVGAGRRHPDRRPTQRPRRRAEGGGGRRARRTPGDRLRRPRSDGAGVGAGRAPRACHRSRLRSTGRRA